MGNYKYPTMCVTLQVKGETVERVVKEGLDRLYVGGDGTTVVYYDTKKTIKNKRVFAPGPNDKVIATMNMLIGAK